MALPLTDSFTVGATAVTFTVAVDGRARDTESEVSVRRIPASNTDYVDLGGRKSTTLKLTLLLANGTALETLEGLVGQAGTLVCLEGTLTAVLRSISGGKWYPSDEQQARADFLVV